MNEDKKYTQIESQYLAYALGFIGYRFFKFDRDEKKIYSFVETPELLDDLHKLMALKKEYNNRK